LPSLRATLFRNDSRKPRRSVLLAALAIVVGIAGAGFGGASVAFAAENPFERGPDPTRGSLEAPQGPFAFDQISVARGSVQGFGGGTIYAPKDLSQGTFGAVAVSPGFTESQSAISWYGPRWASHGFVVITIDTNSVLDVPDDRANQLQAALDYLVNTSAVKNRIDPNRLAVAGHSMGGGATLRASEKNPAKIKAGIPLTPWHTNQGWSGVSVPQLIVGGENDAIASPGGHAIPFYNNLPGSLDKAYLEMRGADHFVTNSPNTTIARLSISWLKRFVDNDTRYDQFLCPAPTPDTVISKYQSTCPYS
jgi:predicted dienelactone hydrolase